ncbi:TIGR02679 domain-containing protein [Ruminococcus sp. 5_1_39BFAA]|uniref:TIGR02679 domain-containing protein n=1 Tax=Ruminococcus sp. 5_1_39BFAA TaxID=457412 RepID=UPI0035683E87
MKKHWSEEPQNSLCNACVEYFRERPVFEKVLRGFREKYISYGTFSGTVTVRNPKEEELADLEGFFQKNYHGQKSISVSAARFEKALEESRFGGVEPKEILELYFQEEMTGKKEQKKEEERKWQQIFAKLREQCAGTWAKKWITEMEEQKNGMYSYLRKLWRESGKNMEEVRSILLLGIRILNHFPYRQDKIEYLAVFAAMMTGNPHAFDDGAKDGPFFRMLVEWDTEHRNIRVENSDIFPALQRQRLYLAAGILRDDMSNYVMISGIQAWNRDGNPHAGMDGFQREGDPVQVPLSVVAGWTRTECPDRELYIVENPSVFAMLCRKWRGKKACMCMNGQPRLSSVLLLDLLAEAGIKIYYAGDFDPEGLLIAQKVKQYYKGETVYWHMSVEEYERSRSSERISEKRRKALERITDADLEDLAEAIRKSGVAGYQENVWEIYVRD